MTGPPLSIVQLDFGQLGIWAGVAIVALAVLAVVLNMVRRTVATWMRVAVIVGAVVVIAAAVCALSVLLRQ